MEREAFSEYLTGRYGDQINWYDSKAVEHQTKYHRMQWSVIVLAALTPILIELDLKLAGDALGHLPTLTSAAVAILTAGLKTFKYQENWINYRTTCETLRKEKHFYDAAVGEYRGSEDKEALFVGRVESLISRENTMWISSRKSETGSDKEETEGGN